MDIKKAIENAEKMMEAHPGSMADVATAFALISIAKSLDEIQYQLSENERNRRTEL